ncbi:cupin domain-containing protein [Virgibacillus sp. MSP4-1]|uniref:sugar phosphate nucleotidyltransferase n=1 Tax=Virgibacillus sp. MSP4-1 TaxID=2700081 RepID=UPI0003A74FFF|nr:sugar phosphate nucleotidyltransferase [Virgibacillus sp. MSP4-1]QHS23492.1 cupin domain-containing protein [Virgibacillus sp. MSP4-1]
MRVILLSGGSGKRLWPLSNDSRSKQFLKVLSDEDGQQESMVQRVWKQLKKNNLDNKSIIATGKSQVDMIKSQLDSDIPIVTEPYRRDTFPAIALAATYLYSIQGANLNDVVSVLPVDSFVENRFFDRVKSLEKAIIESDANIALMGVTPTFPSEKYGYIVPERPKSNEDKDYVYVNSFKEKPDKNTAKSLIENNALWNCGVFAFRLGYVIDMLEDKGLPINFEKLSQAYGLLPKNSFDYEVVEKAEKIVALSYEGDWKDLGTWNTLTEEMTNNFIGKGVMDQGVENTNVINELDIPITVLGINNAVVAASPDGILVTDKENSPKVKDYVTKINGRPMYEERRWGWYKVLDYTKYEEGNEVLTKRIGINAGENLSYQIHYKRSETWTVLKGTGEVIINNNRKYVAAGETIKVPLGTKHTIKAISEMEIIEVQTGSELIEEDIKRLYISWNEIMNNL